MNIYILLFAFTDNYRKAANFFQTVLLACMYVRSCFVHSFYPCKEFYEQKFYIKRMRVHRIYKYKIINKYILLGQT